VRTSQAPPRGTYVEICRGPHRIVARVVWTDQDLFGASARDAIAIDAVAGGEEALLPSAVNLTNDRRARRRLPPCVEQHEHSRRSSRRLEFLCIAAFGFFAASFAYEAVAEALSKPLNMVEARLR